MAGMSGHLHLTPARQAERAAREARLAKALRDNLRRRKEQARTLEAMADPAPGGNQASEPPA
jgi:hypothetical protein